jgi:hypothetical protein
MRILSILTFQFIFLSGQLFSQKPDMKYGKVPAEDLAMTVYPLDTSAAAVVLWDFGETSFDIGNSGHWEVYFKRHKRIKILKRSGFGQGDIAIPFYSSDNFENIRDKKAQVVSPSGEVVEIPKNEFFVEKVDERFSRLRFSCPNLQVGSVIEYIYELVSKGIFSLPEWYFQEEIPVRWSELRLQIPEYFHYVFLSQGGAYDISEHTFTNDAIHLPADNYQLARDASVKVNINRFVRKDMPALKEESFITTMDDYYARMRMQLSRIQYPGAVGEEIMTTWPKLAEELMERKDFGAQISKKGNFKKAWEAVSPRLAGGISQTEKAHAIYQFVNENINSEGLGGVMARGSLDDCFEKKSGRQNEMNLLMIALLREAGIESYPLLVSTRGHGRTFELYPFIEQFNHLLAFAVVDGNELLLDAGEPFRPMGYPDVASLNGSGWLVDKEKSEWVKVPPVQSSETFFLNMALDETGGLSGTVIQSSDGYSAAYEREQLHNQPDGSHFKAFILESYPDALVDSLLFEKQADLDKALRATAKCSLPNMAMVNGDFIYLAPALFSSFKENPLKLENRIYPVDYPYPYKERIVFNLSLPEGYIVEEMPEPMNIVLPNDGGSFKFQMSDQGANLQMVSTVQINQLHYEPTEYASLRNFFSLLSAKMGEQLVLKKA